MIVGGNNYVIASLEKGKVVLLAGTTGDVVRLLWCASDKTIGMT